MDKRLLEILVCPRSHVPLETLARADLATLNAAIAQGGVRSHGAAIISEPLNQALITADRATIYAVEDGIPVLLVDAGIDTHAIADFARS